MELKKRPGVGIGVIIVNKDGQILIGKRKGSHAQKYSIPGGHLELGETFEESAAREIKEETDLDIIDPEVIGITNNLETYKEEGGHYVSVILVAKTFKGDLKNLEPHKCDGWSWTDPRKLPVPHFDASALGISCYLKNVCYDGIRPAKK